MTSAYAAVVAINRQLPDLVLFSESISDRHRERVVDHLKSVSRNGTPPTFSVPALHNGNRAAFITQIGNSLGQKKGQPAPAAPAAQAAAKTPAAAPAAKASAPPPIAAKPAPEVKKDAIDPVELELLSQASAFETSAAHEDDGRVNEVVASAATAAAVPPAVSSMIEELTVDPMSIEVSTYPGLVDTQAEDDEDHGPEVDVSIDDYRPTRKSGEKAAPEDAVDLEVHAAEIALVQAQAAAKMAAEVERVRAEAAEQRATEMARVEADAAAQREAAAKMAAELERVRVEADAAAQREAAAKMAAEIERVRAEAAQQRAADMARVEAEAARQREAAAKMAAELERVRAEAAEQRASEMARIE
ncbi:MAG TPA: hypothetical protein VFP16_11240, partial [Vicinamibacterales bacterium]|nr:hypothetical protein [Vicinamibacterales bacterium]